MDSVYGLLTNCKVTVKSVSDALELVKTVPIVKIADVPITVAIRNGGHFYGDLISNFRSSDNIGIGYVDTKAGPVIIPPWWPLNMEIYKKYGIPHRNGVTELIVDVFFVNSNLRHLIYNLKSLPKY